MNHHTSRRPLSPHLTIYKPQVSSVLSILHRITGFGLSLGLLPLVCWLHLAAYDPQGLEGFYAFSGSFFGLLIAFAWSVAFWYHFANGIRHLFWDAQKLLELEQARMAGYFVLGATLGLSLVTWIIILAEMPL